MFVNYLVLTAIISCCWQNVCNGYNFYNCILGYLCKFPGCKTLKFKDEVKVYDYCSKAHAKAHYQVMHTDPGK